MGEPAEPTEAENNDAVVEVPTTVVVTQDDGTAAAVALEADNRSEMAAEAAVSAGETAVEASEKADAAATVSLSAHDELRAFRGEFGEVRPILAELYQDLQDRKQREAELAEAAAQVQEVPVNDTAARDAEKRTADSSGDSQASSSASQASSSTSDAPTTPGRTGGLRRRHRS